MKLILSMYQLVRTYLEIERTFHNFHNKDGEIEYGEIEHISTYLEIERNLSRATARMVKSEAVRKI